MVASPSPGCECLPSATKSQWLGAVSWGGNILIRAFPRCATLEGMHTRSAKTWLGIGAAIVLVVCIALALLTMLGRNDELARVPIPGSNLTLVLEQDDLGIHRYDVLAGDEKVARRIVLASRGELQAKPQVSILGDRVTVTFHTATHSAPFVEFDLATCRIASHSNLASAPPPIRDCIRK